MKNGIGQPADRLIRPRLPEDGLQFENQTFRQTLRQEIAQQRSGVIPLLRCKPWRRINSGQYIHLDAFAGSPVAGKLQRRRPAQTEMGKQRVFPECPAGAAQGNFQRDSGQTLRYGLQDAAESKGTRPGRVGNTCMPNCLAIMQKCGLAET